MELWKMGCVRVCVDVVEYVGSVVGYVEGPLLCTLPEGTRCCPATCAHAVPGPPASQQVRESSACDPPKEVSKWALRSGLLVTLPFAARVDDHSSVMQSTASLASGHSNWILVGSSRTSSCALCRHALHLPSLWK